MPPARDGPDRPLTWGGTNARDYSADRQEGNMPRWRFIWMVAWPDFRARLTRFLVIGVGMALVLAITLLLSAFSEGFRLRTERLLDVFGGQSYVVAAGSSGPMTATTPLDASLVDELVDAGVAARPILVSQTAVLVDGQPAGVVVVGTDGGEPGFRITSGRGIDGPSDAVVDEELHELGLGDEFVLAGRTFEVVGTTEFATWDIANAGLFIDRHPALEIFAEGRDVVTAIAIDGELPSSALPSGVELQTREQAFDDVLSRTAEAKRSIDSFRITLWALAVVVVGAVLYLAAIDRVRDFAVFKATGAANADLVIGLALQAAFVGLVAGLVSIALAHVMKPIYPGLLSLPLRVAWPVVPVAVVIAVVASFVGIRRAIQVDPSQAFG